MLQQITVRVELGPYVLRGREVEFLEVAQAVGEHAQCELAFTRDPRAVASGVAALRLGELAGAPLRVVFVADAADECLAFEGWVRTAEVDTGATGAGAFTVTALSASYALAEHADRQYFREHTPATLAGHFGVRVAGALPAGAPRDYVQAGTSAWAFLAQVAAEEGVQLRARWPRTPDGVADVPAELGRGFAEDTHDLTWGRELLRLSTALVPANAGVTGAFYDPAEKHDHRFRGVRAPVEWLGGARPVVAAARDASTRDADGGDPGHLEPGRAAGVRARTLAEFRDRLELESARRLGSAVRARGTSVLPALRAGDRVRIAAAPGLLADLDAAGATDGELADRTGVFGLVSVLHRWTGTLYDNEFTATPWAGYHPPPAALPGGAPDGTAGFGAGLTLAVVVDNADPKHVGRVKVRYPWMAEGEASQWVRALGHGGGNESGLGVPLLLGAEVVVGAVTNDPEHPVVVGVLWNGVDRASHEPGRQVWITPAGNTLVFLEGEPGDGSETVELHSREGKTWVQLAQQGPTGVPTVTVHSEGDLSLEAPNGQLRLAAKSMLTHVEQAHEVAVGAAHTLKVQGAVTVESGARLALKAGADVALRAGGALRAHAAGAATVVGAQATLNPPGASAPQIAATVGAPAPSAWGPRPVPAPGPGRSTEDPRTPTKKELAAKAARASLAAPAAPPDAARVAVPASGMVPAPDAEPQTLAAKKARLAKRRALVQGARARAADMPPGPERTALLATAARFEDDTRAVDRMRLAKHVYDYYKDSAPPPLGFEQITSPSDLAVYGLKPEDLAPPGSDFRAALYRSQLDGTSTPILAFRGTTSWQDWKNNFAQGSGLESDYYTRALNLGKALGEATDGKGGFETVGHSLGGGLASAVSASQRMPGDTFNAAGVSENTLRRVGSSRADGAGLLNAYHVDGEVLTALQDRDNQRAAVIASGAVLGPAAAGAIGLAREVVGNRILPTALGRMRTLPAVDPPAYAGVGALNPYKYVNRHFSPAVIAGFEQEKAEDSAALGAPALR